MLEKAGEGKNQIRSRIVTTEDSEEFWNIMKEIADRLIKADFIKNWHSMNPA